MNKERLLELARDLRENLAIPVMGAKCSHFDMSTWVNVPGKRDENGRVLYKDDELVPDFCGTRACLAGLAVLKWGGDRITWRHGEMKLVNGRSFPQMARELLELDYDTGHKLFKPEFIQEDSTFARAKLKDKALAARVLERLVETGEVDWEERGEASQEEEFARS